MHRGTSAHRTPHGENAYSPDSLLRALTANPLDLGLLRPQSPGEEEPRVPDTPVTRATTFLLAVVLGALVAVSVVTLRANATAEDSPRAQLLAQVTAAQSRVQELNDQAQQKQASVSELESSVLTDAPASEDNDYARAGGGVAVHGPGVQLTLNDSTPLPPAPGADKGVVNRVSDRDLQIAVNALWASGAEAIAINGTRLTATSAVRTAGQAVLVDFQPLAPPYVITAVGDPQRLSTVLTSTEGGEYLSGISTRYGIRSSLAPGSDLSVPARSVRALREARVDDPSTKGKDADVPASEEKT